AARIAFRGKSASLLMAGQDGAQPFAHIRQRLVDGHAGAAPIGEKNFDAVGEQALNPDGSPLLRGRGLLSPDWHNSPATAVYSASEARRLLLIHINRRRLASPTAHCNLLQFNILAQVDPFKGIASRIVPGKVLIEVRYGRYDPSNDHSAAPSST